MKRALWIVGIALLMSFSKAQGNKLFCGQAIVDQSGRMLGWTLLQPTEDRRTNRTRYPVRMNVAFGPGDLLVISDDSQTAIVPAASPHIIEYVGAGSGTVLKVNSPQSIIASGKRGEIQEWSLSAPQPDILPFVDITNRITIPAFPGRLITNTLAYVQTPKKALALLVGGSEGGMARYSVIILRAKDNTFIPDFTYDLPQLSEQEQAYVGVTADLSTVVYAQVGKEALTITATPVGGGSSVVKTTAHPSGLDYSKGDRLRGLTISPNKKSLVIGSLLVTHPFESDVESEIHRLGTDHTANYPAAFSPDSHWLAVQESKQNGNMNPLILFNVFTGKVEREIHLNGLVRLSQLAFSPSGDYLAVVGYTFYPQNIYNRVALQLFSASELRHPIR